MIEAQSFNSMADRFPPEMKSLEVEIYDRQDIPKKWRVAKFYADGGTVGEATSRFGITISTAKVYYYTAKDQDLTAIPTLRTVGPQMPEGSKYQDRAYRRQKGVRGLEGLSPSERRVVDFCRQGLFNREIAEKLFICEKTVKFHLTNAFKILDVRSRMQLIARYPWADEPKPDEPVLTVKALADFSLPKASTSVDSEPQETFSYSTHSELSLPLGSQVIQKVSETTEAAKATNKDNPDPRIRAIEMVFDGRISPEQGHAIAALLAVK